MTSKRSSRRQFLAGNSLFGKLRDVTNAALDQLEGKSNDKTKGNADGISDGTLQNKNADGFGVTGTAGTKHAAAAEPTVPWPLLKLSRTAMATDFEVSFNRGQYPQATAAALEALDEIDRIELLLSVFRKESEISSINRNAAREPIPVDPEVWELISLCHRLTLETWGAIDLTASPLWRLWGFARHKKTIPSQAEIEIALQSVGDALLQLDASEKTVHFLKPGVELNLGCVGKGAALDAAALTLQKSSVDNFLIHGGKSSVIARGGRIGETWATPACAFQKLTQTRNGQKIATNGSGDTSNQLQICNKTPPNKTSASMSNTIPPNKTSQTLREPTRDRSIGWTVGIAHPIRHGQRLAEIRLTDEALGTSGSQQQFFLHQGKRYGHIIDPRTGFPANQVLTATVVAPTAAIADAISTAFFVLTPEQTAEYCHTHPEIAALLTIADNTGNTCCIEYFGFEQNQIRFDV